MYHEWRLVWIGTGNWEWEPRTGNWELGTRKWKARILEATTYVEMNTDVTGQATIIRNDSENLCAFMHPTNLEYTIQHTL